MIGIDIGGANLKISNGQRTLSKSFPLWKMPDQLATTLQQLLAEFSENTPLAVTMTGELADCFRTKREGVTRILEAVQQAAGGRGIHVWQTAGEFVTVDEAVEFPTLTAAANWHALATWGARMVPQGNGLLIDIGSTTTDIIPLEDGIPMPQGRTDFERLQSGELIYLGTRRTPVCAILNSVTLDGHTVGLAREVFATVHDALLVLGLADENAEHCDTADGRPATRICAAERLARMVCADLDELSPADISSIAQQTQTAAADVITQGIARVLTRIESPLQGVLLAGEGEALIRADLSQLCGVNPLSLSELVGPEHSRGACAFALAHLLSERI